MPAGLRELIEDVPDEQYTTPLDKAAVRTTGSDITIVGSGGGMPEVLKATEQLQKQGMKVETIDLRCLKPMDTETLVKSVQKTKRLLTVDQSYYTLCPGAEVIARCAENVERRTLQAHRLPRRAAAGLARDVPVDAAERGPHRRRREEAGRLRPLQQGQRSSSMQTEEVTGFCCSSCGSGNVSQSHVRSAFWHDERLVVVEDIPAHVCASSAASSSTTTRPSSAWTCCAATGFPPERARRAIEVPVFSFGDQRPLPRAGHDAARQHRWPRWRRMAWLVIAVSALAQAAGEDERFMPKGGQARC